MSKQFWAVIIVIVLVFVGIFALTGKKNNTNTTTSSNKPTQHVIGTSTTGVKLVEYGDYECPYCEEYYPVVKQVQQEFNGKISFQFRNFPLTSLHPNAFAAARAAEAAGLQNKFWEMHDALYDSTNWQVWSTSSDPTPYFKQYAQQLGLNVSKFESDYSSTQVNNLVNADLSAGNKLGISGTPTFYLNGKQLSLGADASTFEKAINTAIAQQATAKTSTSK